MNSMKNKTLCLAVLLASGLALGSPITADVISAPQGLTINNVNATETLPTNSVTEQILTQGNIVSVTGKTFDQTSNVAKTAFGIYDFSVSGGASTAAGLPFSGLVLPANAIIKQAWYEVITPPTSGLSNTTLTFTAQTQGDIYPSHAVPTFNSTNGMSVLLSGLSTAFIRMTAANGVTVLLGNSTLTAGKIELWVDYLSSPQ